jgi:hypothetical protein
MRNVQVVDGAINTAYAIYSIGERDFRALFPRGRNIEFAEDFTRRVGRSRANGILERLWSHPVHKPEVRGIHGTLFFGLLQKRQFYPTWRELEMDGLPPQFLRFASKAKGARRAGRTSR